MSDPVKQVSEPIRPEDDIGPFYKTLGAICLFAGIGLAFLHEWKEREFSWIDASLVTLLILAALSLIRPSAYDRIVKSIADALPFFRYRSE